MSKKATNNLIKYLTIIFLILWIIGIFVGGKFMELLFTLFGLYLAITFRQTGRTAIEQSKKWNRILPFHQSEKDFGESAVLFSQIMFLIIGSIIFIVGLGKFLTTP